MRCYTADSLAQFRELLGPAYHKLQVLAIDEAQFFPDLAEFCAQAVDGDGKHVIVAGLSGDFRRRRFGQLLELMPLADSITQLTSKCGFCSSE
jgi:thymidine kinase